MPKKELKFEQAMSRLNDIVDSIEDGETTLDKAIKLYKEGLILAQSCGDILGHYESEVLQLQKEADEAFTLAPFDVGVKAHG
ncbi:MAG: exodeoxyribonuclease VII small subunit [Defluviitaleaceae bacterium]|nr:exodeoxyribonuclease VII small subunit [Defluviitaleaceae bacterium]